MTKLQRWSLVVGLLVAAPVVAAWPLGLAKIATEHFQATSANTKWIALSEFKRLSAIKKRRKLLFSEWVTWCQLGQQLGFWVRCPAK